MTRGSGYLHFVCVLNVDGSVTGVFRGVPGSGPTGTRHCQVGAEPCRVPPAVRPGDHLRSGSQSAEEPLLPLPAGAARAGQGGALPRPAGVLHRQR